MNSGSYPADGERSIAVDIILTILTCGLWGLYWQYKQMDTLNDWLGRNEFSFVLWFLLSLVTCGLYGIYYEYKMARGIIEVQDEQGLRSSEDLAMICLMLSIFGLGLVSLAIQQTEINKFYEENNAL